MHAQSSREMLTIVKICVWQVFTSNEQIVLNLGGTKFTTTQATLQNAPMSSILASLLDEQDTVREDKLVQA